MDVKIGEIARKQWELFQKEIIHCSYCTRLNLFYRFCVLFFLEKLVGWHVPQFPHFVLLRVLRHFEVRFLDMSQKCQAIRFFPLFVAKVRGFRNIRSVSRFFGQPRSTKAFGYLHIRIARFWYAILIPRPHSYSAILPQKGSKKTLIRTDKIS